MKTNLWQKTIVGFVAMVVYSTTFAADIVNAITNFTGNVTKEMLSSGGRTGDLLLVYTNTFDNKTFTLNGQARARILAVGGGGAGGARGPSSSPPRTIGLGGGGGGGGVVDMGTAEDPIMLYGGTYSVRVGKGGSGVAGDKNGSDGESSKIVYDKADWSAMPNAFYSNEIIAYGGGGGAYATNVGSAGASGGGGSAVSSSVSKSGGACSPEAQLYDNKGNFGGDGKHVGAGAGGGGAGGRGDDTRGLYAAGNGGEGYSSDITGVRKEYAGGGGGGVYSGTSIGKGKGGGGDGNSGNGEHGTGGGGGGAGRSNSASGAGGNGIVIIRISEFYDIPSKPESLELEYTGEEQWILPQNGPYTTEGILNGVNVCTHEITVTLHEGLVWSDGTSDPLSAEWSIVQARNEILTISISNWDQYATAATPSGTAKFGDVYYEWRRTVSDGEWSSWELGPSPTAPTEPGVYYLCVRVDETENWSAAERTMEFTVWPKDVCPASGLGRFVKLDFSKLNTNETLENFIVYMALTNNTPTGFNYAEVDENGSDIRFCDANGTVYPHEIDEWNYGGTSHIWFKLPQVNKDTVVYMCWGVTTEGQMSPVGEASQIWTDYVAVWHMDETRGSAFVPSSTPMRDATGNGYDAKPMNDSGTDLPKNEMTGVANGRIGHGRQNSNNNWQNGNYFKVPDYTKEDLGSVFEMSAWVRYSKSNTPNDYIQVWSRKPSTGNADLSGWHAEITSNSSRRNWQIRGSGNAAWSGDILSSDSKFNTWVYVSLVYSNETLRVYRDGALIGTKTDIQPVIDNGLPLLIGRHYVNTPNTYGGMFDEMRLCRVARSAAWIKANYDQIAGTKIWNQSAVMTGKNARLFNKWKVEPSLSKVWWNIGDAPATVNRGTPLYGNGTVKLVVRNQETGVEQEVAVGQETAILRALPIGHYIAIFDVDETSQYRGLSESLTFHVVEAKPGEITYDIAEGRIMTAGNEAAVDGKRIAVTTMAYYDENHWEHEEPRVDEMPVGNLLSGSYHYYYGIGKDSGENPVWILKNVRIGNTMTNDDNVDLSENSKYNYLPWAEPIQPNSAADAAASRKEVAQLVMLNKNTVNAPISDKGFYSSDVAGSVIESGWFTNGVGTVFFDAVNGRADNVEGTGEDNYKLRLQYGYLYNDSGMDRCRWVTVPAVRYEITNSVMGAGTVFDDEIPLTMNKGGTKDNFYRIAANINTNGNVKIRIVRTGFAGAVDTSSSEEGEEPAIPNDIEDSPILIDNIIVSYPSASVCFSSYGKFDVSRTGNQILGLEGAWNVPFPSVADRENLVPRAKADYTALKGIDNSDTSGYIQQAIMHYRWRYLTQQVGRWNSVFLEKDDSEGKTFTAINPLRDIPDRAGDIEFWYELSCDMPYFSYVDYSGTDLGIPGFGDRTVVVTNRASYVASDLPTGGGTDWFVRLRNGESFYEGARIEIKEHARTGDTLVNVDMELATDGVWKGYYATTTNNLATNISWRIVMENRQTAMSEEFAENAAYWYIEDVKDEMPISDIMQIGDANSWTTIEFNPTTGYLMFQIEEDTRGISVVHADYQNFNAWTDAAGSVFKGSSALDEKKIGTSSRKQQFSLDFKNWTTMSEVEHGYWDPFSFSDTKFNNMRGQPVGVFSDGNITLDDSGWTVSNGKWISRVHGNNKYGTGVALQMKGQGVGSMSFSNSSVAPRGVKTIEFNARMAQETEFQDFAYYTGQAESSLSNYTFLAYGAFDLQQNKSFDGIASLSLVGYYNQAGSCYEGRFEWIGKDIYKASTAGTADVMDGAKDPDNNRGQRFCLYRWSLGEGKTVPKPTLLAAYTNVTFDIAGSSGHGGATFPMFLCITNIANLGTSILFGVGQNPLTPASNNSAGLRDMRWSFIRYYDQSASRLKSGSYGVLSRNSDGYFLHPQTGGIVQLQNYQMSDFQINWLGSNNNNLWQMKSCKTSLDQGLWRYPLGKTMKYEISLGGIPYIKQNVFTNNYVDISIGTPNNSGKFTRQARIVVDSFKSERHTIPVYSYEDATIKISSGNESDDIRVDPVIDTVVVSQNRGLDWSDFSESTIPGWMSPSYSSSSPVRTNFEFRAAWIVPDELYTGIHGKSALLLSAKRTTPEKASCIRSPLSDGEFGRGNGLGMISYEYYNAQPNARLLIQIATNVSYTTIGSMTDSATDSRWITVATNDFSNLTTVERRHGTFSHYIGLHGVKGVARIVVDPKLVSSVAGQTDSGRFGEVYISKVVFKDEPSLDSSSWWGWNVRNVAPSGGQDKEGRMILHDMSSDPTASGMSMALNWSAFDNVNAADRVDTVENFPFVQTPLFASEVIGEISFKARMYDNIASAQPAAVVLLGTPDGATWEWVNVFNVTNTHYETYSFKTSVGKAYKGFRMIVSGAKGVDQTIPYKDADGVEHIPCPQPVDDDGIPLYNNAVRVMIDEVVVSEAIRARMAFKNVGVFRNHMSETEVVPDVPSYKEQPIVGEGWGVQCEVYPAQLADEVDLDKEVKVMFYWYPDMINWGFNNWRYKSGAKCAELARATDSGDRLIFRSSDITCPEAVVDEVERFNICQYSLEVIYYQKTSSKPVTNELTAADWKRPDWYEPVDYNADFGKGGVNFSAYNIIDTVAPKWAWINEANIAGVYENSNDSDRYYQFVEIACPMDSNLNGWSLRAIDYSSGDKRIITNNQFCVFDQNSGKKDTRYAQSNMSFRVVGSPSAQSKGALSRGNGTLDAVWNIPREYASSSGRYNTDGRIGYYLPIALQLVRPSGVIEHQVVLIGTNVYDFSVQYDPAGFKNLLNETVGKEVYVYAGVDDKGGAATITGTSYEGVGTSIYGTGGSIGVMSSHGETEMNWSSGKKCTPGSVNDGQIILSEELPTPQGKNIRIYCSVDNVTGHIVQTVGDGVETDSAQIVVVKKGSETGTNITYKVAPWYEMGSVATNGIELASGDITKLPDRKYVVTVGVGVSNNVSVVASAAIDSTLRSKYGLDENDKYTPAIMSWLENGKDLYGREWNDKNGGKIYLARYYNIGSHTFVTNLSLRAMYWLDMDPTIPLNSALGSSGDDPVPSALRLVGGISKPATEYNHTGTAWSTLTNIRLQVSMFITNENDNASWTPYALRGVTPGESTFDLTNRTVKTWSGVSFKLIGYLHAANPLGGTSERDNWVPLRYFYFTENSFRPMDDATAPHTSDIELIDPFSTSSIAVNYGWHDWFVKNNANHSAAWYFWSLDDRIKPVTIEEMKKDNYYKPEPGTP